MPETKKALTLRLLQEAGDRGVTARDFVNAGNFRYSARLDELRQEGHVIRTTYIKPGLYLYRLEVPDPEPEQVPLVQVDDDLPPPPDTWRDVDQR